MKGEIKNARITKVSLTMRDHGVLCYYLMLETDGGGCAYGGVVIGKGYLGADNFEGYAKGIEALMRIMNTLGVDSWEDLEGCYCRMVDPGLGGIVTKIGHIIEDKWFDQQEFFREEYE